MKCKLKLYLIIFAFTVVSILAGCQKGITDEILEVDSENEAIKNQSELIQLDDDGIVLLFESDDKDLTLFADEAEEGIVNVVYYGEIIQIEADYQNMYDEKPTASVKDLDGDGENEIIVSLRDYTGTITTSDLYIIDRTDEWNVLCVSNIEGMISESISYEYDESKESLMFRSGLESAEVILPNWSMDFPFANKVEYDKRYRFDINTMTLETVPYICMKDSLPITDLSIFYNIEYNDGLVELNFDCFAIHENETDFWYEKSGNNNSEH